MFDDVFEQAEEMVKDLLQRDNLFALMAQATKKTVDNLVQVGFSRDEAIQIVAGQGIGIKTS